MKKKSWNYGAFSDVHAGASYEVGIKTIFLVGLSIFAPVPARWGPEMRNVPFGGGLFSFKTFVYQLSQWDRPSQTNTLEERVCVGVSEGLEADMFGLCSWGEHTTVFFSFISFLLSFFLFSFPSLFLCLPSILPSSFFLSFFLSWP